jgi:hypothetical protein
VPKSFPREFAMACRPWPGEAEASLAQAAKDSGVSESCPHRWLQLADVADRLNPTRRKQRSGREPEEMQPAAGAGEPDAAPAAALSCDINQNCFTR